MNPELAPQLNPTETFMRKVGPVVAFADGSHLLVRPLRPFGPFMGIDDLDTMLLYHPDTRLQSFLVNQPSQYARPEQRGFWSDGTLLQPAFADIWQAAAAFAESKSDAASRMISYSLNAFGQQTREALRKSQMRNIPANDVYLERYDLRNSP